MFPFLKVKPLRQTHTSKDIHTHIEPAVDCISQHNGRKRLGVVSARQLVSLFSQGRREEFTLDIL